MNDTKIEWTDDTVNPWWGCAKVSPACVNCYAESLDKRWHPAATPRDEPAVASHWGVQAPRMLRVQKAIGEIDAIARRSDKDGRPRRVFIASMADVFEDRADLVKPREELWSALCRIGPRITPLLLTKRPEVALAWAQTHPWPEGAMFGVTVEDQKRADERIPVALQVAALTGCKVFLSMEPLLEPVNLAVWMGDIDHCSACRAENSPQENDHCPNCGAKWALITTTGVAEAERYRTGERWLTPAGAKDVAAENPETISWVIVGGESGHGARPMHPDWARSIRDQCTAAGVPFLFKQWGEFLPRGQQYPGGCVNLGAIGLDEFMSRAAPGAVDVRHGDVHEDDYTRTGKHAAGRHLDGRTWDEVPQ